MTVTDEDREAAVESMTATFDMLPDAFPAHLSELAQAFARHRIEARRKALEDAAGRAAERAEVVAWLREDAGRTAKDVRQMHRKKLLTPKQTIEWEVQIETKTGIADAIERGQHKEATNDRR